MVRFHRAQNAAQHIAGAIYRRLVNGNRLKPPGHRWVFFEILGVFHPGCRPNRAQSAARKGGFQQVRGVAGTSGSARTHQGVNFVDEQNDRSRAGLHFVNHRPQTLFKFTFHAGPSLQQPKIKHEQLVSLQFRRHIARGQTLGKAFDNGSFTNASLARQDRVILAAAQQNVDDLANFFVAANNWIHLPAGGNFGHVHRKPRQRCCATNAPCRRTTPGRPANTCAIHRAHVFFVAVFPCRPRLGYQAFYVDFVENFRNLRQFCARFLILQNRHQNMAGANLRFCEHQSGIAPAVIHHGGQSL